MLLAVLSGNHRNMQANKKAKARKYNLANHNRRPRKDRGMIILKFGESTSQGFENMLNIQWMLILNLREAYFLKEP